MPIKTRIAKSFYLFLLLSIMLGDRRSFMYGQAAPASHQSQNSIKLIISTVQNNFKIGEEVRIKVEAVNISDSSIALSRDISGKGEFSYHTSVLIKGDGEAAKTNYHRALRGESMDTGSIAVVAPGSSVLQSIKPSESEVESINLSSLYKLSNPGVYIVRVERADPITKLQITSNALQITLNP